MRESPALDIILLLAKARSQGHLQRSFVPATAARWHVAESDPLAATAAKADCVVIVTDHTDFDYQALLDSSKLIVDTRNAMKKFESDKIVRL